MTAAAEKGVLDGRLVVLGITGGIAAYKAAEVASRLRKLGAEVQAILTANGARFITPLTMRGITGRPALADMWERPAAAMPHLDAAREGDVVAIVPATANIIGKMACGIGDDLLSSVLLATTRPVVIAPAMNVTMYRNPIVQRNIALLRELRRICLVGPEAGLLACGEEGEGRLAPVEQVVEAIVCAAGDGSLAGTTVVVTAGPTCEDLDPVRCLTNRSSGKMGYALAREARRRGAKVSLVSGPTALAPPWDVELVPVRGAAEMHAAVIGRSEADIVVMAAAVADFTPAERSGLKIKKGGRTGLDLRLEPTRDILAELGERRRPGQMLVGFAAETGDDLVPVFDKLARKGCDLIVHNDVSKAGIGFDAERNEVAVVASDGSVSRIGPAGKDSVARAIFDLIAGRRKG